MRRNMIKLREYKDGWVAYIQGEEKAAPMKTMEEAIGHLIIFNPKLLRCPIIEVVGPPRNASRQATIK